MLLLGSRLPNTGILSKGARMQVAPCGSRELTRAIMGDTKRGAPQRRSSAPAVPTLGGYSRYSSSKQIAAAVSGINGAVENWAISP
jgi:hypothetical protein